jgi:hypothetical protein
VRLAEDDARRSGGGVGTRDQPKSAVRREDDDTEILWDSGDASCEDVDGNGGAGSGTDSGTDKTVWTND